MLPYHITDHSITVAINGIPETVYSDHPNFALVRKAIQKEQWDRLADLFDIKKIVNTFSDGEIEIKDGRVYYQGYERRSSVAAKILDLMADGFNIKPLARFLARVEQNPLISAREELYDFCEANNFMIDEHGYIIAYKKVRHDYTDTYTGTNLNTVGSVVTMQREKVDADRRKECSVGLHFAAYSYAKGFSGTRLMILRVDPADVVAVPLDYNHEKGRTWRYQVIGEISQDNPQPLERTTFRASDFQVQATEGLADEDDLDEDWEDEYAEEWDDDEYAWEDDTNEEEESERLSEAGYVRKALVACAGIIEGTEGAARYMGMTPRSFRRRLDKYNINPNDYRAKKA